MQIARDSTPAPQPHHPFFVLLSTDREHQTGFLIF